ncbi:hypothetical protein GPL21_39160 [Bradyrhizobium pachyrhizi]|uniref:Uncharacterized protein n=1 Tax=Bradyrhizobium pachyrhizi TaxID=280333 RepID=A0A844T4U6_9BRAD|nr:hypothetical protein [Bradyrhizobium pachyrhizi]MVT71064.1 hypothetical protein [Bradyrhizobium pachyrhizi]
MNLPFTRGSVAKLEDALAKDVKALEVSEQELVKASADLKSPDVDLTDDDLKALISKRDLAEVRRDQARNRVNRSEQALSEARAAAEEKRRKDEIARVSALGEAAQKLMVTEVTAATKGLRKAMRAMAQAELEREILNHALPDDLKIPSFEVAVMDAPSVPRKEISRVRELHWINPFGGMPYGAEFARKIRDNGDGTATLSNPGGTYTSGHTTNIRQRRYFDKVVYSDWVPGRGVGSLARELSLPGLKGGPAGWNPMSYVSPQGVLSELDRVEAYTNNDPELEIKEELEAISPIFENLDDQRAWEAKQREANSEAA